MADEHWTQKGDTTASQVLNEIDEAPSGSSIPEDELTDLDKAVIETSWGEPYEQLDEQTQRRARKILGGMPTPIRDILEGDHYTSDMISDAMEHVFVNMRDDSDMPEEWINGASVFAKALDKRLDL